MQIVLSTRNQSKAQQIKAMFEGSHITVVTLEEVGIKGEVFEDGTTLTQNALRKALFVHQAKPTMWTMADDTGIFINALHGEPGVNTARWSGGNTDTEQTTHWILKQLEDVTDRTAVFKTVVAVVSPEGKQYFFAGEVYGKILETPRKEPQPNMPYSSIFIPVGADKTWAEMTTDQENKVSHRGKAFRKVRDFLEMFH